ncbi:MAG: DNA-binding response regulator [Bacteroidetes bacterium]|nr:MAG: DNA-binding response regulator [Bacteroidota bacterium]
MKVLIIEDESLAAEQLINLLYKYDKNIIVLEVIASVKNAVKWLKNNEKPELVFMDIQLADGVSFDIFDKVELTSPVIFITAYDQYAIRAFKVNSIDYLLKPLDFDELKTAVDKFKNSKQSSVNQDIIEKFKNMLTNNYKNRFVIKVGEHIRPINIEQINYFYSFEKATYINTSENRNYVIDYSLEQAEALIDPTLFFRINRKYLISLASILDIVSYSNSRLKIKLVNSDKNDIIVSRERVNDFKKWLDR